jgi:hypothetical protein
MAFNVFHLTDIFGLGSRTYINSLLKLGIYTDGSSDESLGLNMK